MPLQLRRGLDAARTSTVFDEGEPIWTTDTTQLFVGDGVTPGGVLVAGGGGSTSTFDNIQIGTGTYKMFIGESPTPFNNQFFITGNAEVDDRLYFDQFQLVQSNSAFTVDNTLTVKTLVIGTDTAITSRAELIGPTGPAGGTGPTGPAGATGGYSGTERVYALGNTSGTLSVDATSATIFSMTLTGNLTMNAIANVVTGTNATFVITQDGTGGRTLTSSWKFAGGAKTLTTSATATDMISVFYDGSTYYASLSRGFV